MSGWRYAFSLSAQQVKEATPPGTVSLIGTYLHPTTDLRADHDQTTNS